MRDDDEFGDDLIAQDEGEDEASKISTSGLPWEGSDRDYTYDELLGALELHQNPFLHQFQPV